MMDWSDRSGEIILILDEFESIAISVLHCLPVSRPENKSCEAGEDIGNPFRYEQLKIIAKNAGFEKVDYRQNVILTSR